MLFFKPAQIQNTPHQSLGGFSDAGCSVCINQIG